MNEPAPRLLAREGRLIWSWPSGRSLPVIAGGDDGEEEEGGKGKGSGGAGSRGESAGEGSGEGSGDGEEDGAARVKREAADLRRRLRAAERERDELKAAQQTDAERLSARAEAAEGKLSKAEGRVRSLSLRLAVADEARKLKIVDPGLAVRLLDADDVEFGEDGEPDRDALTAALRKVVEAHPILTRSGDGDAGRKESAAGQSGSASMNDWLRGGAPPKG